jgi:hypothetical protein
MICYLIKFSFYILLTKIKYCKENITCEQSVWMDQRLYYVTCTCQEWLNLSQPYKKFVECVYIIISDVCHHEHGITYGFTAGADYDLCRKKINPLLEKKILAQNWK